MIHKLKFEHLFDQLINYQHWTDKIVSDLAYLVDLPNVFQIETEVKEALSNSRIPSDFKNWVISDLLYIRHTLESLHNAICSIGLFELSNAINQWHERLINSLMIEDGLSVLCCGPGAVEDLVLPADFFLDALIKHTSANLQLATTRNPKHSAKDSADVIALLWEAAKQPGIGLKPFIDSSELRDIFGQVFESVGTQQKQNMLGGAQAIMATANHEIGIQADVTWPYHPIQVANFGKQVIWEPIKRVVFEGEHINLLPFDSSDPMRPHRQSFILNISSGVELAGIEAKGSDRVIFRTRRYSMGQWELDHIKIDCQGEEFVFHPENWQPKEWPSLPLLGKVTRAVTKHNKFNITFKTASEESLRTLAQTYGRFIWTGLQALDDPGFDGKTRHILVTELANQLEILSSEGGYNFVELSGVPKSIQTIKEIVANAAHCVGINQTELTQLTSFGSESTNPAWAWSNPTQRPESLLQRYQRGLSLAQYMGTDILIHGIDCTLYLTCEHDQERLQEIVQAILVAKLAVILQLLKRAGVDADIKQPSLAEKGFMSLVQFAYEFAYAKDDETILSQIIRHGYFCGSREIDYSVAIVPVPWPYEVQQINPTGAGDTLAGVVAALLPH